MSQFAGNPHDSVFVAASRGQWFVPTEDGNEGRKRLSKKGKIAVGIIVAVLLVAALLAVFILSNDRITIPKYDMLTSMLGSTRSKVEKKIPKEVDYAGATFDITPIYGDDVLHGFNYTAYLDDADEAAQVAQKVLTKMYRTMGKPLAEEIDWDALTKQAIVEACEDNISLYWLWNATAHSNKAAKEYVKAIDDSKLVGPADESFQPTQLYIHVTINNLADVYIVTISVSPS